MEAIQFNAQEKKLKLVELPLPKITEPNQVLIKVAYAGICGTDLHIIQGEFPCKQDGPVTLGHEFSGVVVDTGSAVTEVKRGDNVAVDPNKGCQVCTFCHSGNPHFCKTGGLASTIGIYRNGETGYRCVSPDELKRLQEDGVLYDIIIDCSGFGPAIESALSLLDFGGILCIFGVSAPHVTIKVSPFDVFSKEATIVGVKINCYSFRKALALLESLGDRYLNYESLGIRTFSIKDYEMAIDSLKRGTIAKAVFKF